MATPEHPEKVFEIPDDDEILMLEDDEEEEDDDELTTPAGLVKELAIKLIVIGVGITVGLVILGAIMVLFLKY